MPHIDPNVGAALIGLFGTVLTLMVGRLPARIEHRIRGLLNGKRTQALEEIDRLYRERQRRGQPLRRSTDRILEQEDHP